MSQWYAVRTATRRERTALKALADEGFAVFMPCETVIRRLGRNLEVVERPLYPGYLFVLCEETGFRHVLDTDGVHAFVCGSGPEHDEPLAIPLAAIVEIQANDRRGEYDRTRSKRPPYRPKKDERVRVTAGPWMGFVGRVLNTPRKERAKLMIEGPHGRGADVAIKHLIPAA